MVVRFGDFDGIVDHHCLNFLFINDNVGFKWVLVDIDVSVSQFINEITIYLLSTYIFIIKHCFFNDLTVSINVLSLFVSSSFVQCPSILKCDPTISPLADL
jgi:hypothetical protein